MNNLECSKSTCFRFCQNWEHRNSSKLHGMLVPAHIFSFVSNITSPLCPDGIKETARSIVMETMVKSFQAVTPDLEALAGGKGGMLVRLFQHGYPVPEGFVVFPSVFEVEQLHGQAWDEIHGALSSLRKRHEGALFAVRSSAVHEDSASASHDGAYETVLNMKTDQEIKDAIMAVFRSRLSERVRAYSSAQGVDQAQPIAVVVQGMVPSDLSGVLFTADPITGSFTAMVGNSVQGLGEKLVSGEANASSFTFTRPKG